MSDLTLEDEMTLKLDGFGALPPERRHALARKAVAEGRTLLERWSTPSGTMNTAWDGRASLAAEWLAGASSVADIGAGGQLLRKLLGPGIRYVPIDCVRLDHEVLGRLDSLEESGLKAEAAVRREWFAEIDWADWEAVRIIDLNRDPLPLLDVEACAMLRFIEYMFHPLKILKEARQQFSKLVISYNIARGDRDIEPRIVQGWVNHLTLSQFPAMLREAGWQIDTEETVSKRQLLFAAS